MKQIAAFLFVLIALGVVVFYFEPATPSSASDDSAVYQMRPEHSGSSSSVLKPEEAKNSNTHYIRYVESIKYNTKRCSIL